MTLAELVVSVSLDSSNFSTGVAAIKSESEALAVSMDNTIGDAAENAQANAESTSESYTTMLAVIVAAWQGAKEIIGETITAYGDLEQAYGGVETMFGGSADVVKENAANAWKTAGMSSEQYLSLATSFSASLLQGLDGDTAAAASAVDMAIKDMADNSNKLGTSMSSVEYAYRGFVRDNFVMLDNLMLGYGGTAGEMAKLINESGVLGDYEATAENVKDVPLHKIFEAIHVIQERLDIAGTTEEEAEHTIVGSQKALAAAEANLIAARADPNADYSAVREAYEEAYRTYALNEFQAKAMTAMNVLGYWTGLDEAAESYIEDYNLKYNPGVRYAETAIAEINSEEERAKIREEAEALANEMLLDAQKYGFANVAEIFKLINQLSGGEYAEAAQKIKEAYYGTSTKENSTKDEGNSGSAEPSAVMIGTIEEAVAALRRIEKAVNLQDDSIPIQLDGISIEVDGEAIGRLAGIYMGRRTRSKMNTALAGYYTRGK